MKENFRRKVLKNGLTILFKKRKAPIVSVAFAVRTGGIHEKGNEKGISHFIEHMLYKGTPTRDAKKIAAEMKKIQKAAAGDFKKMADALFQAIPGPGRTADKIHLVAILKVLAEEGKLEETLEDKRFGEMVISYLKKQGRSGELGGFKTNPRAAQYISALLQYFLKDVAEMTEDDSGRLGMQIFNVLAKKGAGDKFQGAVYFDLEKKEFAWS